MEKSETVAQNISLEQFIQGRSIEIASFINSLNEGNSRRCPQNVHRSLRRRAMSHNRFRIPRRLRMNLNQDLKIIESTQRIPKCRKSLRRKSRLLLSYNQRSDKTRWLWTHLWSAKRMRMMDYFGHRISHSPNDKSYRATYRFSRYGCCLHDMSYYHLIRLEKTEQTTKILHQSILQKSLFNTWLSLPFQYFSGTITHNNQTICPVTIFSSTQHYSLLYHPAASPQIEQILPKTTKLQNYQVYQLIGPQSLPLLYKTLSVNTPSTNQLATLSPSLYPTNYTTTIMWQYNQNKMISSPSMHYCDYIRDKYDSSFNDRLRKQLLSHTPQQVPSFWTEQPQLTTIKITTRSKYTHKRTNKLKKHQKQEALDKIRPQLKPVKQIVVPTHPKPAEGPAVCQPITLAMQQHGCLVITNNNDITLWRKLTFCNAKVIGRHNLLKINNQQGNLTFPQDYPDSNAYQNYITQLKNNNIARYLRLPPNKRVNYLKINSPFPFGPSWNSLSKSPFNQAFSVVRLLMVGRGIPLQHSYICLATEEDIKTVQQRLESSNTMEQVHQEQSEYSEILQQTNLNKLQISQIQSYFKQAKTSRQIIGFVTTGGYSYSRCKGYGIGYVLKQHVELDYFIVRKRTSRHYFIAESQRESMTACQY